jgi:hypothetical protein
MDVGKVDKLDSRLVVRILDAEFPQLRPYSVSYLGEGCDSWAFVVNDRWIFRFPKRADVEAQLLIETQILPRLSERLPVPIPAFCFHGQPTPAFPLRFAGYPMLGGVPAIQLDRATAPHGIVAPLSTVRS